MQDRQSVQVDMRYGCIEVKNDYAHSSVASHSAQRSKLIQTYIHVSNADLWAELVWIGYYSYLICHNEVYMYMRDCFLQPASIYRQDKQDYAVVPSL